MIAAAGGPVVNNQDKNMKLQVPFVQFPLHFDAGVLAQEIEQLGEGAWRPHVQGFPGNSALTLITTNGDPDSDALGGAMRATPWLERCPYLQQVLHSVGGTWGRTRLMRLDGKAEVTPHIDLDYYWRERVRVHVPIVTHPTVRFICGDAQVNMAPGECWIFDTWRLHNVLNPDDRPRIHLVADSVGGEGFWDLVAKGRSPGQVRSGWEPTIVGPSGNKVQLDYESVNVPVVMTPWELREHIVFLLGEARSHAALPPIHAILLRFSRLWHALWSCHSTQQAGWPRYRDLLDRSWKELETAGVSDVLLENGMGLAHGLQLCVFGVALKQDSVGADAEIRQAPGNPAKTGM